MKFSRPKEAGKRLKQNNIKLRQTKLDQYHVTLPKGIVEAMNFQKGDVFRVFIENGNIVLKKERDAEVQDE
jgi:bifunctional DNA-binding transcriptional regulator/antitoxin component of YhaV-PrlF toxin-antitoxin module